MLFLFSMHKNCYKLFEFYFYDQTRQNLEGIMYEHIMELRLGSM